MIHAVPAQRIQCGSDRRETIEDEGIKPQPVHVLMESGIIDEGS